MPGKKRLQEEYEDIDKEDIKKEIKKAEDSIKKQKKALLNFQLKKFRNDILYTLILSSILGYILWAWKPEMFTFWKALALGLGWFLLFEELLLHKMFKRE